MFLLNANNLHKCPLSAKATKNKVNVPFSFVVCNLNVINIAFAIVHNVLLGVTKHGEVYLKAVPERVCCWGLNP